MASMVVNTNPLIEGERRAVLPGTTLRELAPVTGQPLMLRVNGYWLLRDQWWRPVFEGDVVEWHVMPLGGNGGSLRIVLTIALIAASIYTGGLAGDAYGAAYGSLASAATSIAGSALINALVPAQQPSALNNGVSSPGSVYATSLASNQARLNQPIPEIFGRMLVFPDFAAQPYAEYVANDQIYYALFTVGQGSYTLERSLIDNTPISGNFSGVSEAFLPPGSMPTLVLGNVVSSPLVVGQTLASSVYVGGFACSAPKYAASAIGIDIVFPRGLGLADSSSGNIGTLSAAFKVDAQPIDDFGVPTGDWFNLGYNSYSASTNTPQRVSYKYALATPGRVRVRVGRTDVKNTGNLALHDMAWGAMRAYLTAPVTLDPNATHYEIRIRANEQLSSVTQRKINLIVRRKLRTWSQAGGWTAPVETRNAAWAIAHVWTNANGDSRPDTAVDLVGLAALATTLDARQDRFDAIFDSKVTTQAAVRTIAQSCRTMPFQRGGVNTISRDQLQSLPVTAFTSRSMLPGSMSLGYALATEIVADGVIVEYFSNRAWEWREVVCPAPGVTTPANAVRVRLIGITGAIHAQREGLYMAATNVYRRKFPKFQTEMLGFLPAFGSLAIFAPDLPGWGQSGDVAFWDAPSLVMGLSEPVLFTAGATHYISILRDDGSVTPAIQVTPGPTANDVALASAPQLADGATTMTLTLDDGTRERPKYVFGAAGQHRIMVRTLGINKRGRNADGAPIVEISAVAENNLVHAVDNALLPSPGVVQDPVDTSAIPVSAGGSGTGNFVTVQLISHEAVYFSDGLPVTGGGSKVQWTLNNTGGSFVSSGLYPPGTTFVNEWATYPVTPAQAAGFEVRATDISASGAFTGSATGAWLSLGTSRTWSIDSTLPTPAILDYHSYPLQIEIRAVGSTVVLASVVQNFTIIISNSGP